MHKLTKRSISKLKVKLPQHVLQMTRNEASENSREIPSPVCKKIPSFTIRNESESWDGQSSTTTASWPKDMEEVSTRKVIQQWKTVERTLYDENDQLPLGPILDECLQWQNQLLHLRLIGIGLGVNSEESTSKTNSKPNSSLKRKHQFFETQEKNDVTTDIFLKDSDNSTPESQKRVRENVVDELLTYVNSNLNLRADNKNENSLSRDLEDFLTITAAPTNRFCCTSGSHKQIHRNNNFLENSDRRKIASRNKVETEMRDKEKCSLNRQATLFARYQQGDVADIPNQNLQCEGSNTAKIDRSKTGMVFNEKIVVSPVPFVRSTKESFCTLKTTPIQILGQSTSTTWVRGTRRHINSGQSVVSARKTSLLRMPLVHSAWQPPVCPTIWPKNVRLTPIDSMRLPNSKQRTTSAVLSQRGRASLSPIPHTILSTSSQNSNANKKDALEIHGTHIIGQSIKGVGLKSNSSQTLKIKNDGRKKARHEAEIS